MRSVPAGWWRKNWKAKKQNVYDIHIECVWILRLYRIQSCVLLLWNSGFCEFVKCCLLELTKRREDLFHWKVKPISALSLEACLNLYTKHLGHILFWIFFSGEPWPAASFRTDAQWRQGWYKKRGGRINQAMCGSETDFILFWLIAVTCGSWGAGCIAFSDKQLLFEV